ncbi:MAG: hypothetical protein JSU63_01680 [Phycisphaerales bacterium]|nr:MAG: hypothetical protein JSU63_01680 [Phycisphaerales bacterium]
MYANPVFGRTYATLLIAFAFTCGVSTEVVAARFSTDLSGGAFLKPLPDNDDAVIDADIAVVRSRPVLVEWDVVASVHRSGAGVLQFDLFPDVALTGIIDRVQRRAADRYSVFGHLEGGTSGSFVLVVNHEVMLANIRTAGGGSHQIRYLGDGVHAARQIDEDALPSCGVADVHQVRPGMDSTLPKVGERSCYVDDGSVISVLVVYTPLARDGAGSTASIEALVQLAIDETNVSYEDSLIDQRVSLVHTTEVDYDEAGTYSEMLKHLRVPGDGHMDQVHELREIYHADLVALIVEDTEYCGIAYLMQSLSLDFEEWGFSVNARICAATTLSFAHELGHNMGCHHDRANASGPGLYSYSYGYQEPNALFRTVMAYNCPTGCPRVHQFSNPDVLFEGLPTGVPLGDPQEAHNVLTLNNSALTVANLRHEDCNCNGVDDEEDVIGGASDDCNGNLVPDECEIFLDCNTNGVADFCDIAGGTSEDCNENTVPDDCEPDDDCNSNGIRDFCDIFVGTSDDCNDNGVPDECEPDCNTNGVADSCDISSGSSQDCNLNDIPDECDTAGGASEDCDDNSVPDECEFDCNSNGIPDPCEWVSGTGEDANGNGVLDECEQEIIYVDANATGQNTGQSWTSAYVDLQDALVLAAMAGGTIEEIWVAAGTYTPTDPNGDPTISFELVDGVALYGGFAGGETSLNQRSFNTNQTILSGNLGGTLSVNVVRATGTDETAVVDGFTITGGGITDPECWTNGGGLHNDEASPTVRNCLFESNSAKCGGAMYNDYDSHPTVTHCVFIDNHTCNGGGALYNYGDGTFINCAFFDNRSGNGGAMYNYGNPTFINCLFSGNEAYHYAGGAIMNTPAARPTLINCTFFGNSADDFGGGIYRSQAIVSNCIFWGNRVGQTVNEITQIDTEVDFPTISFTCLQGWTGTYGGVGNFGSDPLFSDADGHDDIVGTVDDNLRLAVGSPCLDAGHNLLVPPEIVTDLKGDPRFQDDPLAPDTGCCVAPIVDIGALEGNDDCNGNGVPDADDLLAGTSLDCNANERPDECEPDCNGTLVPDDCDVVDGTSPDCNGNMMPDECEVAEETSPDCNANMVPDECDVAEQSSPDCNSTGVPDECELTENDCDSNGVPDECDPDCNENSSPDACDIASGVSRDCTANGIPDECEPDCNLNGVADTCDIADQTSEDANADGIPDECAPAPRAVAAPHDARKNRYVSFNAFGGVEETALRIELSSMRRCNNDLKAACVVDEDCPGGACAEHPHVGTLLGWVSEPDAEGVTAMVSAPVFRYWPEPILHVGGCAIVPVASYDLRATTNGVLFSDPFTVGTILKPQDRHYGDTVGVGTGDLPPLPGFTPPNGIVNVNDVTAYLLTAKGDSTPSAHTTWVDLHGLGDGAPPNYILNVSDLQRILLGLEGQAYTDAPDQLDPADCP